jgi:hypothetical protein
MVPKLSPHVCLERRLGRSYGKKWLLSAKSSVANADAILQFPYKEGRSGITKAVRNSQTCPRLGKSAIPQPAMK